MADVAKRSGTRWLGTAKPGAKLAPPRNDAVPASVERVLLVAGGLPRGELPPIAPPGVGDLVLLNGAMFPVLSRVYDPETRTARVEIPEA